MCMCLDVDIVCSWERFSTLREDTRGKLQTRIRTRYHYTLKFQECDWNATVTATVHEIRRS